MLTKLPWLGPLIVFGLVVFVHELGHFLAAKAFRVYAPRFSIGFGPALLRKRFGETEYVLAALPLGGYVRMASRDDATAASLEGGDESDSLSPSDARYYPAALMPFGPHPVPADRTFESKPLWQRLVIMVSGVTMNIVLAIVVMTALVQVNGRSTLRTRVVGRVDAPVWAAGLAAIVPGDTIVSVGGKKVASWNDIGEAIVTQPDTALAIVTNRATATVPAGAASGRRRMELLNALTPWYPPVAGVVVPNRPAARAGLQRGDTLVAIDSTPIRSFGDLIGVVSVSAGKPLRFSIRRGSESKTLVITPEAEAGKPRDSAKPPVGKVGVGQVDVAEHEDVAFGEALSLGWGMTWDNVGLVMHFLQQLGSGQASMRDMGGPIAITQASVEAARSGASSLFALLAFLSVNLAVMNLLPVPILDGGQIVMNVAESIKGRPFSMRTKENFARVGLFAIGLLFVVVMFNDIRRIAGTAMGFLSRVI